MGQVPGSRGYRDLYPRDNSQIPRPREPVGNAEVLVDEPRRDFLHRLRDGALIVFCGGAAAGVAIGSKVIFDDINSAHTTQCGNCGPTPAGSVNGTANNPAAVNNQATALYNAVPFTPMATFMYNKIRMYAAPGSSPNDIRPLPPNSVLVIALGFDGNGFPTEQTGRVDGGVGILAAQAANNEGLYNYPSKGYTGQILQVTIDRTNKPDGTPCDRPVFYAHSMGEFVCRMFIFAGANFSPDIITTMRQDSDLQLGANPVFKPYLASEITYTAP